MSHTEYDITPYRSEFKPQIVELLQDLWGNDPDSSLACFEWKYDCNPHMEHPLGIVAHLKGRVVGFRGYFATRYEILGRSDDFIVLCPGDTCVHPDHRRKRLSVAMGRKAMREYAGKYSLFLNFTCTKSSLPGYRRMGFLPLADKVYVTRSTVSGLVKHILATGAVFPGTQPGTGPLEASRVRFGEFGDIVVSPAPRPEEMSLLAGKEHSRGGAIRPVMDEEFFSWRFANPKGKYVFYYLMKRDAVAGYVVMGISPNSRRGYILDFARGEALATQKILKHVIAAKHFDVLSIQSYCLDDSLSEILRGLGFAWQNPTRIIEKTLHGELPLLVRPVKETVTEGYFMIGGIDTRRIENWSLKPICSDAA